MPRFNVRTFLDPRDDEGHLIAKRVSEKKVAELTAASAASIGDDFFPVEVTEAPTPRFHVKRHPIDSGMLSPWVLKDRSQPARVVGYATHELALRAADNIVRRELGRPERIDVTTAEIREAMSA